MQAACAIARADEYIDRFPDGYETVLEPVSYTHLDVYKRQVWPDAKTTAKNTGTVLLCSVAVGACIWIFDGVAMLLIKTLIGDVYKRQTGSCCGTCTCTAARS